jgi:hypothetical protein
MPAMNIILYQDMSRGAFREASYQDYARPKCGNEKPAFSENVVRYDFLSDYA